MVHEITGVNKKRPRPAYKKIPFRNDTIKGQMSFDDHGRDEEDLLAYDKEDPAGTDTPASSSEEKDDVTIIKVQCEKRAREIVKKNCPDLSEQLYHYILRDDHNNFIYHDQEHSSDSKMASLLSDAAVPMQYCGDRYQDHHRYQVLAASLANSAAARKRFLRQEGGRDRRNGIQHLPESVCAGCGLLQEGKHHRGDKATIAGQFNNEGQTLIVGYACGKNNESDDSQGGRVITHLKERGETKGQLGVGDGLFNGTEMKKVLKDSGKEFVNTNVTGKKTPDVHADHQLDEAGRSVVTCAYGKVPLDSKLSGNGLIASKMSLSVCRSCPHYKECCSDKQREKFDTRSARAEEKGKDSDQLPIWFKTSRKMHLRAVQNRGRSSREFCELFNYRNGVEADISYLRNTGRVDSMPRGSQKVRETYFGIKVTAFNVRRYLLSCDRKAQAAGKAVKVALKGGNYVLETV